MLAGLNYFISYYDHSAAKWRLWFDWKERVQDRECLRCKHKGNEYKHCCEFHARRFIKINRLSSFFSEIWRPKFSKTPVLTRWRAIDRTEPYIPLVLFVGSPHVFPLGVVISISHGCYVILFPSHCW